MTRLKQSIMGALGGVYLLSICSCHVLRSPFSIPDEQVIVTPDGWPEAVEGDIFRPKGRGLAPAVLLIHGGVKVSDDGRWVMRGIARKLQRRGFYVLNISYRTIPEWTFPAQKEDVESALQWMRQNADREGIDVNRMAVFGYSAGGYLGALVGLQDSEVKAVVVGSSPMDLRHYIGGELVWNYLGGDGDLFYEASPVNFVSRKSPPFFIFHGTRDGLVRPDHVYALMDRLEEENVAYELRWMPRMGHVSGFLFQDQPVNRAIDFLEEILGPW